MKRVAETLFAATCALALTTVSVWAQSEKTATKEQLIGTWLLESFKATTGDNVGLPLGEHPGGYVGITSKRFWVMIVDSTRKRPAAAALTDGEAVSSMKTGVAYTGTYEIDPSVTSNGVKMTIHVDAASNQATTGTTRILYARADGSNHP
jgi:hypothetical protein